MWLLFALLSALFASVRKASEKQLSHKLNHATIGWSIQLTALPLLAVALLISGELYNPFSLGASFWLPTLVVWLGFYPLSNFLYFGTLQHGELSKTVPLQSLGPVLALGLAWLLLGQMPTLLAAAGIALVVGGVYILNLNGAYLRNPLKMFSGDKANRYALFNLVLIALVGVLDKIAIDASGPVYFSFVSTLGAVVVLYIMSLLSKTNDNHQVRRYILPLSLAGNLFGVSYVTYMLALGLAPIAYVAAARNSSIIIGALIGFWYLKEPVTRSKLIALGVIGVGVTVLGLYS